MPESGVTFTSRIRRRTPLVYGLLLAAWATIIIWQVLEYRSFKESARTALINRSRDIAATLSIVIRSQRRFGGIVSQERLESALNELAKSGELVSVALLNASGYVVAFAGKPLDFETTDATQQSERWTDRSVTLVNLIDLGASVTPIGETNRPTIILSRRDTTNVVRNVERGFERGEPRPDNAISQRSPDSMDTNSVSTNSVTTNSVAINGATNTAERAENPRDRGGRPRFGRPFWMDEKEYQTLTKTRGLHGLVIAMSTDSFRTASQRDLWLRFIIGFLSTVSVVGIGLAWQNLVKTSELQVYLLRASELTSHLREMNVAAAGLAHETRNPLNIVRGLAQMISREPSTSEEVRGKSLQITDEVDRVTAQLNEFINYSRPREVRRSPVALGSVIRDVVRALQTDIDDKSIQLNIDDEGLTVDADAQLLRQVIFNLLINSIQSLSTRGEVEIVSRKSSATEVQLDIRDNGPGVSREHRNEIFKPYFTTRPKGTGLGLAVVQQIVLAHGWEIQYIPKEPHGAIFRLSRLKLSTKTA
jgi:signal transduction histidine kinase